MVRIRNIETFLTRPEGIDLVVVKVETSEPGLTGYGCATFTQRASAVAEVVDRYLAPLLVDRDPARVEDLWRLMTANSYWRRGPVLNNAVAGIDMALWDIKGKTAGLPLYELFGGAVRDRVDVYRYADGSSIQEVINAAKAKVAAGLRYVRCQLGGYGGTAVPGDDRVRIDPKRYMATAVEMLQEARRALGPDIEIIHDIHERLPLAEIARFARRIEELGLFFLEDPVPPDHVERLRDLRRAVTTPIALGELFTTPEQWREIIAEQLIDYIRVHVSHIGGITPARKLAALAEAFGVRTAWHGPGDCSPFGHAANLHLDLAAPNFGIQEYYTPQPVVHEIFPGTPEVVDGALIAPTGPGLGIGFNEERAKEFPPALEPPRWTRTRSPDGTLVWP